MKYDYMPGTVLGTNGLSPKSPSMALGSIVMAWPQFEFGSSFQNPHSKENILRKEGKFAFKYILLTAHIFKPDLSDLILLL